MAGAFLVRIRGWWRAALVLYWIALFTGTHLPNVGRVSVSDKVLHLGAFFGLSFLLALTSTAYRALDRWTYYGLFFVLAVYAAVDELLQIPVGRHADVADWVADCVGAIAGLAFFALLRELRRYWIRSGNSPKPHSADP